MGMEWEELRRQWGDGDGGERDGDGGEMGWRWSCKTMSSSAGGSRTLQRTLQRKQRVLVVGPRKVRSRSAVSLSSVNQKES